MEKAKAIKTKKLLTSRIVAAVALALALSAPCVQGQNMTIYSNALANGWQDWGWATLNYANTSPVYTGCADSINVTMSAWQGIQIVNTEMSDAPYASISFWLNGGASGGQNLQMYGLEQVGSTQNSSAGVICDLSKPQANTWTPYTVTLSELGGANVDNFTGFVIQDSAGTGEPTFDLDDIQLNTNAASGGASPANIIGSWSDVDIGSPGLAGSASDINGNWTVTGGGSDIWNTADQFNFVSTSYISDGSIIANVTSLQNSDPGSGWSKAGVMFRNDATAGSVNVSIVVSATQGVSFQWRSISGAQSSNIGHGGISAPVWLQLVRSGDNFSGYYSRDGINWMLVGTEQIAMNGSVLAGLDVTAHNNSALNTATFTNVSLSSQAFGVYRQLWTNLNENIGNTLAMLTNTTYNPNWPNNPAASCTHVFTNFETELNTGTNYYGQWLQTFVVPPMTGDYTFWGSIALFVGDFWGFSGFLQAFF